MSGSDQLPGDPIRSDQIREDLEAAVEEQVELLSMALDDPAAIARRVAEWLIDEYPDRIGQAYWIDLEGESDKGPSIRIFARELAGRDVSLDALVGRETIGAAVFAEILDRPVRPQTRVTVSAGLGAVTPYDDLGDWRLVGAVKVSF